MHGGVNCHVTQGSTECSLLVNTVKFSSVLSSTRRPEAGHQGAFAALPAPEARGPAELPPLLRSQKCQRGEAGQGWHPEGKAPGWERGHLLEVSAPQPASHTGSAGWGHLGFLPGFQRKKTSCAPSAVAGPFPRRACRLVGQPHPQLTARQQTPYRFCTKAFPPCPREPRSASLVPRPLSSQRSRQILAQAGTEIQYYLRRVLQRRKTTPGLDSGFLQLHLWKP